MLDLNLHKKLCKYDKYPLGVQLKNIYISTHALWFHTSKNPLVFVRIVCYLLTELHKLHQ